MIQAIFKRREPDINITPNNFIIGIILWVLFTITCYSFTYSLREVFRILTVNQYYDVFIFSKEELIFYNFFFAFVAAIFGQSLCFSFWLDKPKAFFSRYNYRKNAMIHDQRVLNSYFLHWFSKMALILATMLIGFGNLPKFKIFENYKYLLLFILLILFAQTWNHIRLNYKIKSFKWQFYSFVFICILSASLAFFNPINYQKNNEIIISKNVFHQYNLQLPSFNYNCNTYYSPYYIDKLYIAKNNNSKEPYTIIFKDKQTQIDSLSNVIDTSLSERYIFELLKIKVHLYIDKEVKMDFIKQVNSILQSRNLWNIGYSFLSDEKAHQYSFYRGDIIPFRLSTPNIIPPPNFVTDLNEIHIRYLNNKELLINKRTTSADKLQSTLYQNILKNPDYIMIFHSDKQTNYNEYLQVLITAQKVIDQLRNEYAFNNHHKSIEDLDNEIKREILNKYPFCFRNE